MQWSDRIGRRIKLRDLHILLAVAQSGSMSRAANHLAISHPVVSKTIGDLERTLGVRLLDRKPDGVEATAYGRTLLACSTRVFDDLRLGVQEIAFLADPTVGELRVDLAELTVEPWLMTEADNVAMSLVEEGFRSAGCMPPKAQVVSNSMALRTHLIESGNFIGILPGSTLHFGKGHLRIKVLPVRLPLRSPPTVLMTAKNRTPNPLAAIFEKELRAYAKSFDSPSASSKVGR